MQFQYLMKFIIMRATLLVAVKHIMHRTVSESASSVGQRGSSDS